jgi:hypothetical protein
MPNKSVKITATAINPLTRRLRTTEATVMVLPFLVLADHPSVSTAEVARPGVVLTSVEPGLSFGNGAPGAPLGKTGSRT